MVTSIADAARQMKAQRDLVKSEAEQLLDAYKSQFSVDEMLLRNGISAEVKGHVDRVTLELRRGEEDDRDFAEFSVGISHEGSLIGPWDGTTNVRPGVSFLSDEGATYLQQLPFAVVRAFNIRV